MSSDSVAMSAISARSRVRMRSHPSAGISRPRVSFVESLSPSEWREQTPPKSGLPTRSDQATVAVGPFPFLRELVPFTSPSA